MSGKESFQHEHERQREVDPARNKPLWQRIGWLLVIWTGSVLALAVFAMLLRMKSH
jgi:hypothetical protein